MAPSWADLPSSFCPVDNDRQMLPGLWPVENMAEDCDPAVLHARVCVLEADNKRHDSEIGQLWGDVSTLKACAASLPEMKDDVSQIRIAVDQFKDWMTREEGVRTGKQAIWATYREPILRLIYFLASLVVLGIYEIWQHLAGTV